MDNSQAQFDTWQEMMRFQYDIASRWLDRARNTDDPFAKFFFLFSGFNSLYFLWGHIDSITNSEGALLNEVRLITHLLSKLDTETATSILNAIQPQIEFFRQHRPISRMDKRTADNPRHGNEEEGRSARNKLATTNDPAKQLKGLGSILYLVRSNLVHGSKIDSGDDSEIIEASLGPLEAVLVETLGYTSQYIR